jgi:PLP dependent protein
VIDTLPNRLADVRARIARAAGRAGRDPASIRLVAISKTFPADAVRAAAAAGQVDFGENKVQEAFQKMDQTADLAIRWHLVGHLQSNKAKKAGARFDVVQSVDDAALLSTLDEAALAAGHELDVLVQVDLAGEATKFGAREEDLEAILAANSLCRAARIVGLMLIPPAVDDPTEARPYFAALRTLRDRLVANGVDAIQLSQLSMGMSHDFEVAIEEGATLVRVGTAIFGSRTYSEPVVEPRTNR